MVARVLVIVAIAAMAGGARWVHLAHGHGGSAWNAPGDERTTGEVDAHGGQRGSASGARCCTGACCGRVHGSVGLTVLRTDGDGDGDEPVPLDEHSPDDCGICTLLASLACAVPAVPAAPLLPGAVDIACPVPAQRRFVSTVSGPRRPRPPPVI